MLSAKVDQVRLTVVREPGEAYQASPGTKRERRYRIQPPPKIILEVDGDDPKCQWLENPRTFLMARLPANPNILFGKTVESAQRVGDQAAFVFRDLSCQEAGEHRLQFTLFSRDSDHEPAYMVKHIDSEPFVVVANRSARRRSDRSKNSPKLRHRISCREALSERSRLEPKKKLSSNGLKVKSEPDLRAASNNSLAVKAESDMQMHDLHDEFLQPMLMSPDSPTSPILDAFKDNSFNFLASSSPAFSNLYSSPLGISCGMEIPRAPVQPFTPYGTSFSMPHTPRDSGLPAFPWCFGDLANESDSAYEIFPDPSDSPQMWPQSNNIFSGVPEVQPFTMPLLQTQWRMGQL